MRLLSARVSRQDDQRGVPGPMRLVWMEVDESVIIELKANRSIIPVHIAQMRSLRISYPVGLILNFGATELQWEIIRSSNCGGPKR
jgi:hypothetical protein